MAIVARTGFDGSSPSTADGVSCTPDGALAMVPHLKEPAAAGAEPSERGSRLWTRLVNREETARRARMVVDWRVDGPGANGHDLGYVRHECEQEWTLIPGARMDERRIGYDILLPPGCTDLALYPEFSVADAETFVERQKAGGAEVGSLGKSAEGRDVWMLSYPSPNPRARPFFVQARDHAYETAGSYCLWGIGDFLLSGDPMAQYLRGKFHVFLAPMTNPDGVYRGLTRLTRAGGADMNRVHTAADPAHDALRAALDRIAPNVHMNVHNWTNKFLDGLLANEASTAELIQSAMPADHGHAKRWMVEISPRYREGASPGDPGSMSWKNYCKERFDAIAVTYEFPWFALNTADMRRKGQRAFTALALAAIEQRGL